MREKLIFNAWYQRGSKYSLEIIWLRIPIIKRKERGWIIEWKDIPIPKFHPIKQSATNNGERDGYFRCDGLVEYAYEQIGYNGGEGFIPSEDETPWWKAWVRVSPLLLRLLMQSAEVEEPDISFISLKGSNGNPIEPDEDGVYRLSGRITIEANISYLGYSWGWIRK